MRKPIFRWQVTAADTLSLAELLEKFGHQAALASGRVFVDRVRTQVSLSLLPGQVVEVYAPGESSVEPYILARRDGVLAISKPAGMSTEPDRSGEWSVVSWLAEKLGLARAQIFAVSRLDQPVSGVLLIAVDPSAVQLLARAKEEGRLVRHYLALVGGKFAAKAGMWRFQVHNKPAETHYSVLQERTLAFGKLPSVALLRLSPVSGRMHQLRLHTAHAGAAILGDARNRGVARWVEANGAVQDIARLMLHASSVSLRLPGGEVFFVDSPVPEAMLSLWRALGGSDEDFLAESDPPE